MRMCECACVYTWVPAHVDKWTGPSQEAGGTEVTACVMGIAPGQHGGQKATCQWCLLSWGW